MVSSSFSVAREVRFSHSFDEGHFRGFFLGSGIHPCQTPIIFLVRLEVFRRGFLATLIPPLSDGLWDRVIASSRLADSW